MLRIESYFETFLIIFLISLFLLLLKDFLVSILFAATLVFLSYKPYKYLVEKTRSKTVPALFVLFLIMTMILLPSYLVMISLINQTPVILKDGGEILEKISIDNCNYAVCRNIENNFNHVDFSIENIFRKVGSYISNSATNIFDSLTALIINIFVFILAFFFLLKDGDEFARYLKRIIPMKLSYKDALFLKFRDVTEAVFINTILIAIIQGILLGIGFWIFGISSPIFWSVIASFFALIPVLGAPVVWVPVVIYQIAIGDYLTGILLALYCATIVGFSDNLLRPILLRKRMKVHSFLIFLSILGGLNLFGFVGIFLGPIIISLLISVLQLYKLDFR